MLKAVIFDLDGVLIDSLDLHYVSWKKMLADDGISITKSDFSHVFGMTGNDILRGFYSKAKKNLDESALKEKIDKKNAFFREFAASMLKPSIGSVQLLEGLKTAGVKAAIGTSAPGKNVEFYLEKTGLGKYFSGYVCADHIKKGKPDPEVFLKAAQVLNEKPEDCVVVEDALHGIEAAKRGGMKAVAVASTNEKSALAGSDLVVDNLAELGVEKLRRLWK
ncbi:beta-phosphoglucomutase family hydrolase [Candidatus Woesearchaeota archaeon]|nr:beta-phosphoglucomutase family hydrolase [Candidatus Woesearchaeota archaeon]